MSQRLGTTVGVSPALRALPRSLSRYPRRCTTLGVEIDDKPRWREVAVMVDGVTVFPADPVLDTVAEALETGGSPLDGALLLLLLLSLYVRSFSV